MSNISIRRTHNLEHSQAVRAANRLAAKLEAEHGVRSRWDGDTLHFKRSGVDGTLHVAPKTLQLHIELGFMLALFRDSIEQEIKRTLDDELSAKPNKTKRRGS